MAMTHFEEALSHAAYQMLPDAKSELLRSGLDELCKHHYDKCSGYSRIIDGYWRGRMGSSIETVPFLPVSVFKDLDLKSVAEEEVRLTLTSSGTTGQTVSRIALDSLTSGRQQRALANSVATIWGPTRLPMLIMDTRRVFSDRSQISARGAGVLGMMRFGRNHAFALNDNNELDIASITGFLEQFSGKPFAVFGFTFLVWSVFLQIKEHFDTARLPLPDFEGARVVHSGGWKKLISQSVSAETFRDTLVENFNVDNVVNFYGMVEQIGSVFLEEEPGVLYPPNFSDFLIRDAKTFEVLPDGEEGLIQVLSLLPLSYPGHSLLTEDLGYVSVSTNLGQSRRRGLRIVGRMARSELRGCSDVMGSVR